MFFTYVLKCIDTKHNKTNFYTGFSEVLPARVIAHKNRLVKTTKTFDIIELIYYEACLNKTDALKREKQLKTGFGRGYIKKRIENYLNSVRD